MSQPIVLVPESEPEPEPEPAAELGLLTWSEVRAQLPGAADYEPALHVLAPRWLDSVDSLWLRVGDQCRPISFDARTPDQDARSASLAQCHEFVRKAEVVCTAAVEVGQVFSETGYRSCASTLPSGAGSGSLSAGAFDDGSRAWSLVAANEDQLRYAKTWDLWVEAERLMWVDSQCSAPSVAALNATLAAEGISEQARPDELHKRYHVIGHRRRCMEDNGARLHAQLSTVRNHGDRGAGVRAEPGEQDCTITCPDTAKPLRRLNAVLTQQPFVHIDDSGTLVVHRTKASCESTTDGGLPALTSDPCREM